jgi:hypothetical protein
MENIFKAIIFGLIFWGLYFFSIKQWTFSDKDGTKVFTFLPLFKFLRSTFYFLIILDIFVISYNYMKGFSFNLSTSIGILLFAFLVFFLALLLQKIYIKIGNDGTVEYSNCFGSKKIMNWKDIKDIKITKDGYQSIILISDTQKIKFPEFMSGRQEFISEVVRNLPNLSEKVKGL